MTKIRNDTAEVISHRQFKDTECCRVPRIFIAYISSKNHDCSVHGLGGKVRWLVVKCLDEDGKCWRKFESLEPISMAKDHAGENMK